jgi:hypothetical protein
MGKRQDTVLLDQSMLNKEWGSLNNFVVIIDV